MSGDGSVPGRKTGITLNAEAQEWYPASHKYNAGAGSGGGSGRYSAQNRLRQIRTEGKHEVDVGADFNYLQGIVARVTADPGHFEEVIDIFMQTLHVHLNSPEMMAKMADFIFMHAIDEPSFRYNAARLCVLIQEDSVLFKHQLEGLCLREVEKNRQKPGFTLFLAEIYTQSKFGNWKMLYDAVNKLICLGGDENVKTACQTLKLAGYNLDTFNKHMMDDVVKALDEQKSYVQKNINSLIDSVLTLRSNKWGHNITPSGSSTSHHTSVANGYIPNETFYGPSGEELTEAERRFLDGELDDLDDPDGLYDPEPEMDEEIQAAFKEFVKMSK